eukprot:5937884-Pyramimonas_sp.AAC.1
MDDCGIPISSTIYRRRNGQRTTHTISASSVDQRSTQHAGTQPSIDQEDSESFECSQEFAGSQSVGAF